MNIQNLLYRSESDSLDFKEEQYKFINEDNKYIKSELLKDILAFANSWRDSDAYILIGIREKKDNYHEIVGISEHIDDASLQEFINSKTNRAIKFEYATTTLEDKQIAYIKIPTQRRPFYVIKDYGNVKTNTVYLRRGSATVTANPDEISAMGEDLIKTDNIIKNPTNYKVIAKFFPLNFNSEKELIQNNVLKAQNELNDLNQHKSTAINYKASEISALMGRKYKNETQYKDELNQYKIRLDEYIKFYNQKLIDFKYFYNIYKIVLLIENIGNTFDKNIDININFSKGKLINNPDLASFLLEEFHTINYPEKPVNYIDTKPYLASTILTSINNDFSLKHDIIKISNPNAFYRNIDITDNHISVIIKEMNVGDNIYVLNKKLYLISDIDDLEISTVIKSNKSTSKLNKNVEILLKDKSININDIYKDDK